MAITKLDVTIKKPTINCSIQKKEIKCSFREVLFTYNEDYEVDFLANHLEGAGNIKITEDEQNKKVIIDDTHNHDSQYLKKNEKAVDSSKLDGKEPSYYTTAQNITYDNSASGLSSTNIQDAIDELDNALDNLSTDAKDIIYDNTTSGLSATNVQDALDEIDSSVDSLESDVTNLSSELDAHKSDTNNPHNVTASQVSYDNTTSGLSAGNVQSAIDEVVSDLISHINDQNNPHNVTASQIGGQNILNELLNVDGEGSGLDADLVRGLPADFTCSKTENGYTKLPNGLIIQWGRFNNDGTGNMSITFPLAFPNDCFVVVCTDGIGGNPSPAHTYYIDNITTMGFEWKARTSEGIDNGDIGIVVKWMAIGY